MLPLLIAAALLIQTELPAQERPGFAARVDIVTVTATVTGKDGRFVSALEKDDFTVYEDGRKQDVAYFVEDAAPVSLGILLDASGSMSGARIALARDCITHLVLNDLRPADEWFLARFGYSLVLEHDWTAERELITSALRGLRATGDTALFDAVALAIPIAKSGRLEKKALLVVSDGGETRSLLSLGEVRQAIGEGDVRVYAIGVDATSGLRGERVNAATLRRITDDTGGRTEIVSTTAAIPSATARLADELRHEYLMGYTTSAPKDGRLHTLRVDVRHRGLTVRARKGFVAN